MMAVDPPAGNGSNRAFHRFGETIKWPQRVQDAQDCTPSKPEMKTQLRILAMVSRG